MKMPQLSKEKAKELGRKGGLAKKGKKHKSTLVKAVIQQGLIEANPNLAQIEQQIKNNIAEFIFSNDRQERLVATKFFADYVLPKKKEFNVEQPANIVVNFRY